MAAMWVTTAALHRIVRSPVSADSRVTSWWRITWCSGAYTGVHQFCRVGENVMAASGAKLSLDAPPFTLVAGDRAHVVGLNEVGLKRRGIKGERQLVLKRAFRTIFRSSLRLEEATEQLAADSAKHPEIQQLLAFLRKSERGFCR